MLFPMSDRAQDIRRRVTEFMDAHVYAAEAVYAQQLDSGPSRWAIPPVIDALKAKAKADGLWNLFLPEARILGAGSAIWNTRRCARSWDVRHRRRRPSTARRRTPAIWRHHPLRDRRTKGAVAGAVAAGDHPLLLCHDRAATSPRRTPPTSAPRIRRDGDDYVINGRKWWTSGAMDPRCKIAIFMGMTNPDAKPYQQQSMILVPLDTPGVRVLRHAQRIRLRRCAARPREVVFENVRVPAGNILLGEGRGFEIAQGRLGPGRIHHCMRMIGMAERALETMCRRAQSRTAFRQDHCRTRRDAPLDRRVAHGDRPGAPADAERGAHDGRRSATRPRARKSP